MAAHDMTVHSERIKLRRIKVLRYLRTQKFTQQEIADRLGVSLATIKRDCDALKEVIRESSAGEILEKRAADYVFMLDEIVAELFAKFIKSEKLSYPEVVLLTRNQELLAKLNPEAFMPTDEDGTLYGDGNIKDDTVRENAVETDPDGKE